MRDFVKHLADKPRTEIEIVDSINFFTKHVKDTVETSKIAFMSLCGAWGSGKTSLLKTLEKHEKSIFYTYCFFHFSSWSSNDINMKRDFLLKLIETINSKHNNIMFNSWIEAVLSGKKIKEFCIWKIRIGQLLAWILLTILIFGIWISIGATVHNLINEVSWYKQWSDLWKWGIIFVLTALSIIPLFYYTKGDATKTIPAFLPIDNSEPNTDLSDYQFQNYLLSILTYLPEDIKLFIILDDIDRIMPDQIPSSLSLLFSLKEFTNKQNIEETKENKMIIVTPYDKEQFQNILKNTIPQPQDSQKTPTTKDIFTKFMDKLFLKQVPMPVLPLNKMIKTLYSNLYKAGFKIISEQSELTDTDINVMNKLYEYLVLFFIKGETLLPILIRDENVQHETVKLNFFYCGISRNASEELDVDETLCQKLVTRTDAPTHQDTIIYQNISNSTEFYNSLGHCMYKKYNELIGSPQNRSFKKMYQLFFFQVCIHDVFFTKYSNRIFPSEQSNSPNDKVPEHVHYGLFNLREQIVLINRMVTYRNNFEQKFKDDPILTEEKENIFDILLLCATYQNIAIDPYNYENKPYFPVTRLPVYKDLKHYELWMNI